MKQRGREDIQRDLGMSKACFEISKDSDCGPVLVLALAGEKAVQYWNMMLGPETVEEAKEKEPNSLRAEFAMDDTPINQLHGSSTPEEARRELEFFFPVEHTLAVIKPDALDHKGKQKSAITSHKLIDKNLETGNLGIQLL
ncbi:hypothetical protein NDU88_003800 [Pleurodeles waltl]|uniref:Nucleoside diphosphate kinase-like domain-containing protein n=1 Tax=Pleurodeles waltl TaxID=8319 RepID=A0AAV7VEA9_PLEWA|nr:hypothetical protein NDU88_003800 [Pleurodeles waltl]